MAKELQYTGHQRHRWAGQYRPSAAQMGRAIQAISGTDGQGNTGHQRHRWAGQYRPSAAQMGRAIQAISGTDGQGNTGHQRHRWAGQYRPSAAQMGRAIQAISGTDGQGNTGHQRHRWAGSAPLCKLTWKSYISFSISLTAYTVKIFRSAECQGWEYVFIVSVHC